MRKILIIADNNNNNFKVQLIKTIKRIGCQIIEAESGEQGLEILDANPDINLIICDLQMHPIAGKEICSIIINSPYAKIPIMLRNSPGAFSLITKMVKSDSLEKFAQVPESITEKEMIESINIILK